MIPDPLLLNEVPDALFTTREEHIDWVNSAAALLLGAPREQVVGRRLTEVMAPGELDRLKTLEKQRQDGWWVAASLRVRLVRLSDGVEVPCEVRFGHRDDSAGRHRVLAAREVSEAVRAEGLMSRLALLSANAGALLDADALLDASAPVFAELGWGVAQIEVWGERAGVRRLVAGRPGEPIVEYTRGLLGVEVSFERFPVVAQVVRGGRALFLDNVPSALSGPVQAASHFSESMSRSRLTRSVWAPVWIDDRPGQVLVVVGQSLTEHDFVAIQLFAAQLAAAVRLGVLRAQLVRRERLAAVGEMSAVLAHEMRNPLGVIFNALAGIGRSLRPGGSVESAGGLVAIVREEAERLQQLVTDLLDFARPITPSLGPVALAPLLGEVLDAASQDPSHATKHPQVEIALPKELPAVMADPELLRRAALNLLINAIQNVPEGGRVRLGARQEAGEIHLHFFNDGQPITPAVASRLFEPFFTTRAAGTGLGLAVVRRIVDSLAGRVALDSTSSGVSFSVWLPAAPGEARPS